jgi:stearoyl-CoA desaturase (delta-9 desaturase)
MGWLLDGESRTYDSRLMQDFEKFPELRLLDKYHRVPAIVFGATIFAVGGFSAFVWGFVVSTVLLWHGTFTINSLAHVWGSQRYPTEDQSRNNFVLAVITLGEGWHNNHHQFISSARPHLLYFIPDVGRLRFNNRMT